MNKFFLLLIVCFVSNYSFGQADPVGNFNKHVAEQWKGEYVRIGQYRVKGSPYLLGESFPGSITYKGGRVVSEKILYDVYNQKAGVAIKNEIFESDTPLESFSFNLPEKFGGKTLLFKNPYIYGSDAKGYLNVVEDGKKLVLLKIYKSRLFPDPTNVMIKDLKIFEQYFDYYIYNKATKKLTAIKLRKKDIVNEINDEAFIKNYLSSNSNDLSNEANVIRLITLFNSF